VPKQTIKFDLDLSADESKLLSAILGRGPKPLAIEDVCVIKCQISVRSRQAIATVAQDILTKAQKQQDADEFAIQLDESMLRLLQTRLKALGGTYPVIKKTDNVGEYLIAPSARRDLLKDL
jgi:hypothetical protein